MTCNLCPRNCGVDRKKSFGFCKVKTLSIARVGLHFWEEPCISGKRGSGTIFFSGCNLRCIFCQNSQISRSNYGVEISTETLGKLMLYLQKIGAENINLVSPTQFADLIVETLKYYKPKLKIPIIYNSNGYESVEQLQKMHGLIDVYLPDFKYSDDKLAVSYSQAPNYFDNAKICITEMKRQQPRNVFVNGMLRRGVIVRHLVLPGSINNSKGVIDYLASFDTKLQVSLMSQYFPTADVSEHSVLNRRLQQSEYDEVCAYFRQKGLHNGNFQELDSSSEEYVPEWNIDELNKIIQLAETTSC